jgi:hypothetical protein
MMSFAAFELFLNKIPKNVRIDFSGYSEPFLNPNAMDFVEHTINEGYSLVIYSTLMGVSIKDAERLSFLLNKKKINYLVIHLPDDHNNMPGFKISEEYLKSLEILLCSDNVSAMTMSKNNNVLKFIDHFVKKNFPKRARKRMPKNFMGSGFIGWRRGGALEVSVIDTSSLLPGVNWKEPISCASTPFYDGNVIVPNGNVHLCTMDYAGKHILANLNRNSYNDIFSSIELSKVQENNRNCKNGNITICRKCEDVLVHEFNYSDHGWRSFRPGHLIHELESIGIPNKYIKKSVSIIRSLQNIKKEFN